MRSELDYIYIDPLTKREKEVLQLLADGISNQEIADKLVVEISTVKWYNRQIYDKLQVKNRKQAVIRAQTLGILELAEENVFLRKQHNLPFDTFPFVGREHEINDIIKKLTHEEVRLMTILGAGGMGKTRLSIEVGRRLLHRFLQGVYFISFAPITLTEQIITTIADTIGFKFHSDVPAKQQLLAYLENQNMLLIIDNFEHLLTGSGLLTEILKVAPHIRILVTSRETLNLSSEVLFHIRGLSVPFEEIKRKVTEYDGVKLFIEASQRRNVELADADIEVVADICQLVGGMPLAILLATAWIDTLSLAEILSEIKSGLDILEASLRDALERHQNIENVFGYSYKRLSEKEQEVFRKLSVFRDGFTREAAKAVTGASIRDLQRLVHTSFLQYAPSGHYAILELMRQYGEEKLKVSSEMDVVREKHARFFADLITPLGDTSWGMATREMLAEVNADFENVRAAWYFQVECKDIAQLRRFLDGIWHFLDQYSRSKEGIDLFEPLLTEFQNDKDDVSLFHAQLIMRLGWFYNDIGQPETGMWANEQALKTLKAFNSTNDILLFYFGLYLYHASIYETGEWIPYAEMGYELALKTNDVKWLPAMTIVKGAHYNYLGQHDEAQELFESVPDYKFRITIESSTLVGRKNFTRAEQLILEGLKKYGSTRNSVISPSSSSVLS